MKTLISTLVLALTVSGCMTPPQNVEPPSVTIRTTDKGAVRQNVIARQASGGWSLRQETDSMLTFTKVDSDVTQSAITQVLLGNQYSSKPVYEARYTIVQTGAGVMVMASVDVSTTLPGGAERRMSVLNDGRIRQSFVNQLALVKDEVER